MPPQLGHTARRKRARALVPATPRSSFHGIVCHGLSVAVVSVASAAADALLPCPPLVNRRPSSYPSPKARHDSYVFWHLCPTSKRRGHDAASSRNPARIAQRLTATSPAASHASSPARAISPRCLRTTDS